MSGWWLQDYYAIGGFVLVASWAFWVIFSITLHELAHGWAAIWQGDDTPIRLQRMTMNPLVHMGGMSLLMFAVIGIAWGAMPVDPSKFRWRRQGNAVVAAAGPAMNLLLALFALTAGALWIRYGPGAEPLRGNVSQFLMIGGMLNLVLMVFNLLPVPPLDGSQILMGLSFRFYRLFQNPQAMMFGMFVILAIFMSGIGGFLFEGAATLGSRYIAGLSSVLP